MKSDDDVYFVQLKGDAVNHPVHYNDYDVEVIDMMTRIWGEKTVAQWCYITAFKYRMRAGHKDKLEQDLAKEKWYLKKAKELLEKPITTVSVGGKHECETTVKCY